MRAFVFFAVGHRALIAVASLFVIAFFCGFDTRMRENCPRITQSHFPVTAEPLMRLPPVDSTVRPR